MSDGSEMSDRSDGSDGSDESDPRVKPSGRRRRGVGEMSGRPREGAVRMAAGLAGMA